MIIFSTEALILQSESLIFINFYAAKKKEYVLSKQILRSGTSIGANISEAQAAMSKKDFLAKMYISFKECNETLYRLKLLFKTEYINKKEYDSLYDDAIRIKRTLSAITKTTKEQLGIKES